MTMASLCALLDFCTGLEDERAFEIRNTAKKAL